jgi:hypothetical protein
MAELTEREKTEEIVIVLLKLLLIVDGHQSLRATHVPEFAEYVVVDEEEQYTVNDEEYDASFVTYPGRHVALAELPALTEL